MSTAFPPFAFLPSPRQRRLLRYLVDHPELRSVQGWCAGARVARASYYNWRRDAGFRFWLVSNWMAELDKLRPHAAEGNQSLTEEKETKHEIPSGPRL